MAHKVSSATITSAFKAYSQNTGRSEGGELAITIHFEEGTEAPAARRIILEEREKLDLLLISTERAKGTIQQPEYEFRRDGIKSAYDKLLKRS